mgnify:CR=1 FL=1
MAARLWSPDAKALESLQGHRFASSAAPTAAASGFAGFGGASRHQMLPEQTPLSQQSQHSHNGHGHSHGGGDSHDLAHHNHSHTQQSPFGGFGLGLSDRHSAAFEDSPFGSSSSKVSAQNSLGSAFGFNSSNRHAQPVSLNHSAGAGSNSLDPGLALEPTVRSDIVFGFARKSLQAECDQLRTELAQLEREARDAQRTLDAKLAALDAKRALLQGRQQVLIMLGETQKEHVELLQRRKLGNGSASSGS